MLTFHIIYTQGTIRTHTLFLQTLLAHSDCRYCLVANGCDAAEEATLARLADSHNRLTYYKLPTDEMWQHGKALAHLHDLCDTPYFCFMDSDIYAQGDFLHSFLQALDNASGVFFGQPIYFTRKDMILPENQSEWIRGSYVLTPQGACLGLSFFAMYDNSALKQVRRETGVSFDVYRWEQIPKALRPNVKALVGKRPRLDTAKLLNILLLVRGHKLVYLERDQLVHLGGMSYWDISLRLNIERMWAMRLAEYLPHSQLQRWLLYVATSRQPLYRALPKQPPPNIAPLVHKALLGRYFHKLLTALVEAQPPPPIPPLLTEEMHDHVKRVTQAVLAMRRYLPID